jgi:hypothetical protein
MHCLQSTVAVQTLSMHPMFAICTPHHTRSANSNLQLFTAAARVVPLLSPYICICTQVDQPLSSLHASVCVGRSSSSVKALTVSVISS